jgi:hypothetical protein
VASRRGRSRILLGGIPNTAHDMAKAAHGFHSACCKLRNHEPMGARCLGTRSAPRSTAGAATQGYSLGRATDEGPKELNARIIAGGGPDRRFELKKRRQYFVRSHNETVSVVASDCDCIGGLSLSARLCEDLCKNGLTSEPAG